MRKLALLVLAGSAPPLHGTPQSSDVRSFCGTLVRSGWTGEAATEGMRITARNVPLCSQDGMDALEQIESLPEDARSAFAQIARVNLNRPGWLMGAAADAGNYSLGMSHADDQHWFVLARSTGEELTRQVFWVNETSDSNPRVRFTEEHGAAILHLEVGGIDFPWRWVLRERHEAMFQGFELQTAGAVTVRSNLYASERLQELAREADRSLSEHAKLLGGKRPPGAFLVNLIAEQKDYEAVDLLLTGGSFAANGAFTSDLTRQSYIWPIAITDPGIEGVTGLPHKLRALVVHELHHQVARRLHPLSYDAWPQWIKEGLAELGTANSLSDGEWFEALGLSSWMHLARSGRSPTAEDILQWTADAPLTGRYVGAYSLVRGLSKDSTFRELFAGMQSSTGRSPAALADEFFAAQTRKVDRLHRSIWNGKPRKDQPPAVVQGYLDRNHHGLQISSAPYSAAMAIDTQPCSDRIQKVTAEIAFLPGGNQEADFYLAYQSTPTRLQWLKLAVLPQRVVLFHFLDGKWTEVGRTADLETALETGTAEQPVWHPVRIVYDSEEKTLEFEAGNHLASFDVAQPLVSEDTRMGIGCFHGVLWIRSLEVSTSKQR